MPNSHKELDFPTAFLCFLCNYLIDSRTKTCRFTIVRPSWQLLAFSDKNLQKPLLLSQTQPSSVCVFYSVSKSVVHCIELPVNETASCFLTEQGEISIIRSGVITVNSLLVAIISVLFCPCFYGDVLISDSLAQQVTLCPIMQLFSCFTEDHYQDMTTAKVLIRCHCGGGCPYSCVRVGLAEL